MTVFGTIFEVNSSIGKLCELSGHFDQKDTAYFKKYHFLLISTYNNCVIFAKTV